MATSFAATLVVTLSLVAGDILIGEHLARPYAGGHRQSWCE